MTIVSMNDLEDTAKIESLCVAANGPVFIAKNGHDRLVVMNFAYFEKILDRAFEAKMVNEGISNIENGMIKEGETVRKGMKKKYGF